MDKGNYKMLIEYNINEVEINKAYQNLYVDIGTIHGKRVLNGINAMIKTSTKNFTIDKFILAFENNIANFIRMSLGQSITSVKQSLIKYLLEEVIKGRNEGLDMRQIAGNIKKLVNSRNFYRWQAMRIARTETTSAANYGASIVSKESTILLEKEWISANDARVRRKPDSFYDHNELNGTRVGENESFNDNGSMLRFPGDPDAAAGTRINCRCAMSLTAKLDQNGDFIFR